MTKQFYVLLANSVVSPHYPGGAGTVTRFDAAIEGILTEANIVLEQMHHGDGLASWAVCARALARGHGIRTGLEDTIVLPDGRPAANNAELVHAAAAMMRTR